MAVARLVPVLLLATSAFAQYGVVSQKPFPNNQHLSSGNKLATSLALGPRAVALDGTKAYAYNFFGNYYTSLDLPGFTNLKNCISSSVYIGGADFDNSGDLYVIQASSNVLYKVDYATSSITSLGAVTGLPSSYLVGLAYDGKTQTMYCLQSSWGTSGSLYTINLTTLQATLVGTIPGMTRGEALAFRSEDRMLYAFDFKPAQSDLLKINPSTGAATVVGSTTAFLNYDSGWFGDADFNDKTGELIFSTYNSASITSDIWSINAVTATPTRVNTISDAQLVLAINTATKTNAAAVPALTPWALAGLAILLLALGLLVLRMKAPKSGSPA